MAKKRTSRAEKPAQRSIRSKALSFDEVRAIARTLPGIDELSSYGTPGFKVRGRFLGRLHEDGESLVLKMDLESRAFLTRASPDVYYFTEHYRN
ncbi:MAG: hypothetical protein WEE89_17865 [Gemmatimonadota bacterium]